MIRHIHDVHCHAPRLAEASASRDIERGVRREVIALIRTDQVAIAVGDARSAIRGTGAIINVAREPGAQGQIGCKARVERVTLIVIDRRIVKTAIATLCANQPAGDGTPLFGDLVRICEVKLPSAPQRRAAQRRLPGPHQSPIDGNRNVYIRLTNVRMVEKVIDPCLEIVDFQRPTSVGDYDSELMLFITFTAQRRKAGIVSVRVRKQWARDAG